MKKVMIVDDEVLVRIGIQSLIKWEEHGYQIVCDASDGQEALEKIEQHQPDIVLTDLKMDPVDGFALIEKCRERYPHIQFIVLSSYNDFDNVRKAMKLGAFDYIFKLTVKPAELLKVLEEVSGLVKPSERNESVSKIATENLNIIKKELLKKMVHSEASVNVYMEQFNKLPLKVNFETDFAVLTLTIDNFGIVKKKGDFLETGLLLFTMENIIEELFNGCYKAEVIQWKEYDFLVVLNCKELQDYEIFVAAVEKEFHIFVNYARQYYGIEVSGALSNCMTSIEGLKHAVEQNEKTMEQRFFGESSHLYRYKGLTREEIKIPEEYQLSVLKKLAKDKDFYGMEQFLDDYFSFLEGKHRWKPEEVRRLLRSVYRTLAVAFSGEGMDIDIYVDYNGANMETAIKEYSYLKKIALSMTDLIKQYRQVSESNRGGIRRREIAQVKSFVMGHLKEEISVAMVAEMANMSESHFSHIFKNEEGISFMEYVYQLRMDRAMELLKNSDLKINEVAEQIGIENSNYFSVQFKKRTGCSPLKYRQECISQDLKE